MGLLDEQDPLKAEIARLEQQIQMAQAQAPGGDSGVYGLLGYNKSGGQQQQNFQPSVGGDQMRQIYGLLAEYGDDPAKVGNQFVAAMQRNDSNRTSAGTNRMAITDAMRPRPVGGGFANSKGQQIVPVWDPNLNNGRGGFRSENVGQRLPERMKIGDIQYVHDPAIENPADPNYWVPAVNPREAGQKQGDFKEESNLGAATGTDRAAAQELAGMLTTQNMEIQRIINHPEFDQSVGMMDQFTGKIGAQMGTTQGVLMKDAAKISTALTMAKATDWKGAISEKELSLFQSGVPQVGDGPETWRSWYFNQYIPFMEFVQMRGHGEIDQANSNLQGYIQGAQQRYEMQKQGLYSPDEEAAIKQAMGD